MPEISQETVAEFFSLLYQQQKLLQLNQSKLENLETALNAALGGLMPTTQNIVPLSKAWKPLGYSNYQGVWRRVESGHYRPGVEALDRRPPGASSPEWYLDIEKCLERDRTHPSKRKPSKRA